MSLLWWFILLFAIIGLCSTIRFWLTIFGIIPFRPDLDRFSNPNEPWLVKIVKSPWRKG